MLGVTKSIQARRDEDETLHRWIANGGLSISNCMAHLWRCGVMELINDLMAAIFDDPVDVWLPRFGAMTGILAVWLLYSRLQWRQRSAVQRALIDERCRLAGELHDLLGHGIVAVAMYARQLRNTSPEATAVVEQIDDIVHATSRRTRELVGTLRRAPADTRCMTQDIVELAARLPLGRLSLLIRGAQGATAVPLPIRAAVLRLVQEGLTNAAKYGGAPVRVAVSFDAPLTVTVSSGVNEDATPLTAPTGRGYGLEGLRRAVREQGGCFESGATGNGGFMVRARFPSPEGVVVNGSDACDCHKPVNCR